MDYEEAKLQGEWEQTRLTIYYLYCSYPKKGQNPTYKEFKKNHLPLSWDKPVKLQENKDGTVEMTPQDWDKVISNLKPTKKLSAAQVSNI